MEISIEEVGVGDVILVKPGENLSPVFAALVMIFSSVSVLLNALRLKRFKPVR